MKAVWYRTASDEEEPQWLLDRRERERRAAEHLRGLGGEPATYHKRLAEEGYAEQIAFETAGSDGWNYNCYWVAPNGQAYNVDDHWGSAKWILGLPGEGGNDFPPNLTKHTLMHLGGLVRVQARPGQLASEMVGRPTAMQLKALKSAEDTLRQMGGRATVLHEVHLAPEQRYDDADSYQELETMLRRLESGQGPRRSLLPAGHYFDPEAQ